MEIDGFRSLYRGTKIIIFFCDEFKIFDGFEKCDVRHTRGGDVTKLDEIVPRLSMAHFLFAQ